MPALDLEKRKAFARAYVTNGGNGSDAARKAGVPPSSARAVACRWLQNPAVLELIRTETNSVINELVPAALGAIARLIEDSSTPAATRLAACKDVLDRAAYTPPKRSQVELAVSSRPITEMTREELERIAAGVAMAELLPDV